MKGTNWWRAGLFTAFQPWSGSFGALSMVWATAHTTQFATPGAYSYLANGTGAGTGSGLLGARRRGCAALAAPLTPLRYPPPAAQPPAART